MSQGPGQNYRSSNDDNHHPNNNPNHSDNHDNKNNNHNNNKSNPNDPLSFEEHVHHRHNDTTVCRKVAMLPGGSSAGYP